PDQALHWMQKALTLAHELAEPHGLAHTFFFSSILHQLRRERRIAQEQAEAALAITTEHKLMLYHANAVIARSWASMEPSRDEEVEQLRQGLVGNDATGTVLLRPHLLALLVEALETAGRVEEALEVVDEAIRMGDRNAELYYQAELYRLK